MKVFPVFDVLLPTVMVLLFLSMVAIQFIWTVVLFARLAFHKHKEQKASHPPVSIIITARNEENSLIENLPYILEQKYEKFEVIVVNNQSIDDTSSILKAFDAKYEKLRVIQLERNTHLAYGKKLSITIAIKGAKYDHILLTNADCRPASRRWITSMTNQFSTKKQIMIGYTKFVKKKGLLNRIIRLDNTIDSIHSLSFAKARFLYKGTGKNMGYTREIFLKNSGFKEFYALQNGEEDLFLQKIATHKNYALNLSPLSYTIATAETTWKSWMERKSIDCLARSKYSVFKKLLLGIYPLTLVLMFVSFVILMLNSWLSWVIIGAFGLLLLIKWLILGRIYTKLEQRSLIWGILLWDLLFALLSPIIYYTHNQTIDKKWK